MIGTSNHRSPADAGARGAVPAGESPAGIPWKLNPPVFSGDSVHFRSFEKKAIIFAEYVGFGHVLKDSHEIPVADPSISYAQLRSQGYTDDEIDAHRRAYQFLRSAITFEVDRGILHRAHSPTEAWRSLEKSHNLDTVYATQTLHQRFLSYTMRPGQNPLVILTALEEMAAQLSQQNFPMAPDQALLQFLTILPDSEFEVEKLTCSTGQRLDRDQVLLMIRTTYDNLQRQRNKEGGRRDAGHAFIADAGSSGKSGGRSTPRGARNRGSRGRGGRGGWGGNGGEKGGEKKDGQMTNINASDGNVDGKKGGDARCSRCGEGGHKTVRCPGQMCSVCGGKGHSAKICTNVVAAFACDADVSGSGGDGVLRGDEQDAFFCNAPGKFFDEPGKWDTNALAWQMGDLPVFCDNGASCHMSPSSTGMINYREANATMRPASGKRYPIEGYGDLPLTFRSSSGEVPLLPCNVAHVPSLSYQLISLRIAADNGHTYTGNKNSVTVKFKTGETLFFPSVGRVNFLYAYRPGALNDENANALIAPGPGPSNRGTPVDINAFRAAQAHAHEGALRKTARQMGVTLKGGLHECKGCSMAKAIRVVALR